MAGGKLLILGGIRSGKSAYAESLLDAAGQVTYVATAAHGDPGFTERIEAHRFRRPASWTTVEAGPDPELLLETLGKADAANPILVDDLGNWATNLLDRGDRNQVVRRLADAVRDCAAPVILVSPEVGLSVVPATEAGLAFADLLGLLNQAIAAECDEVTLIVAGQATTLKRSPEKPVAAASSPAGNEAALFPEPVPAPAPPYPAESDTLLFPEPPPALDTPLFPEPMRTPPLPVESEHIQAPPLPAPFDTPLFPEPVPAPPSQAELDTLFHTEPTPATATPASTWPSTEPTPATATPASTWPSTEPSPATATPASTWPSTEKDSESAAGAGEGALTGNTRALPIVETGFTIRPGMDLPIHDDQARLDAERHLSNLDISGSGLGALARTVVFAAGTQGRAVPASWQQPYMLLLNGIHEGDVAAGDDVAEAARIAAAARSGEGAIGQMAAEAGVAVKVVDAPAAGDIAYGRAAEPELISAMLLQGWRLTDEAVDGGADLIILGSCGPGAETAAAAVVSRITGGEIASLLGRIVGPDGRVDDPSWMLRCAALRDALHRARSTGLNADEVLAELGGPDLAIAAGVILGATARRTAVMIDGPVGAAGALLARDLGSQSRLWSVLPDHGGHPTTKAAADVLGLNPVLDLRTGLGEGATSLLALPLMRTALRLSAQLPPKPEVLKAPPGFEESYPLVD